MVTRRVGTLLVALGIGCSSLLAQDTRARVQGIVTDATQAVVAGATVTLRNNNTGVQTQQQTSPTGQYIFDLVLPGTYTVQVDIEGFKRFVQQNVLVQARGDVTVNSVLEVGNTAESITVESSPVAVQFNTTTMALTLDTKMTNSLPVINRNPFLLVALNPAVVVNSSNEQSPYHHWAANQFDVGGNTNIKNDIILDGAPSMTSQKSSYSPPMDAVQEVNLQQNAVDAEFGHSAGGVISMQMKSGTNDFHGTAYYLGRNPALNALADRITRGKNLTRQNVWGVTSGNPIKANKLFNFFAYEGWRTIEPKSAIYTMPTAAEAGGDFSRSLNTQGGLRPIYDPWTTQTNGNTVTRDPFPSNIIPSSRFDPTAKKIMGDLWHPNSPGTPPTGVNNFLAGYANRFKYWNLMDRVDWNASDKLRVFGRYNQFRTFTKWDDFTGSIAQPVDGSKRHAISFSGDAVYMFNPNTILNIRGSFNAIVDSFGVPEATLQESDLEKFWPGNAWYEPYLADLPDIYYPGISVRSASTSSATASGNAAIGKGGYWYQEPDSYNIQSKLSKNIGRHFVKSGVDFRKDLTNAARPRPMTFDFWPNLTANTYNNPNTALSGNAWATFLLGAMDQNSTISSIPIQRPRNTFFALFLHDDFKLSQRLTLNLGLRYEYYSPMTDPEDRLSRSLDLTNPIPELQGANAPVLPPQALALRTGPPIYNGAWIFTDGDNRGAWEAPKGLFLPRVGLAWRVNNMTALRLGYARYIVPSTLSDGLNILGSVPYPGFDASTNVVEPLLGVPQAPFSDPYPGGLTPVTGKSLGRYTNLGLGSNVNANWYQQDFSPGVNDRFNVSLQRELPGRIVADVTLFFNFGRDHPYTGAGSSGGGWDLNQVDPRIGYSNGNAINASVPNPFFNLLPRDKMPGQLRTQRNIAVRELLRPYPQYGPLFENIRGDFGNRYRSLQLSFQRPFANGLNFVAGYNYNNSRNEEFYDELDNYLLNPTWQPARQPRHRLTGATIYQLPFGKGRPYLNNANGFVDGVFGGWEVSTLFTYNSGTYLRFGGALVDGDPGVDEPTKDRWFDTSKFKVLPAFTRRANPLQYDSTRGPRYVNFDATVAKMFPLKGERLKFELRAEAYNLFNAFTGADPDVSVTSNTFGKITAQRAGIFGRQIQFSGRFIW